MVTEETLIMMCIMGGSLALPCGMVVVYAIKTIFLVMVLCIIKQMDDKHSGTLLHSLHVAELFVSSRMACLCLQVMLEGSLDFGDLTGPVKVSRLIQLTNFTQHSVPFSVVLEGRMPVLVTPMSGELGPTGNESSVQKLQVELRATFPESIQGRLKVVTEGADVHDVVLISGIAAQVKPYPHDSTCRPLINGNLCFNESCWRQHKPGQCCYASR